MSNSFELLMEEEPVTIATANKLAYKEADEPHKRLGHATYDGLPLTPAFGWGMADGYAQALMKELHRAEPLDRFFNPRLRVFKNKMTGMSMVHYLPDRDTFLVIAHSKSTHPSMRMKLGRLMDRPTCVAEMRLEKRGSTFCPAVLIAMSLQEHDGYLAECGNAVRIV